MFRRKKREKEREDMAAWMQQELKELKSEVQKLNIYNEELFVKMEICPGSLRRRGELTKP